MAVTIFHDLKRVLWVLVALMAFAVPAHAQTAVPTDGTWFIFGWSSGAPASATGNPYTFTCAGGGCTLDITDTFSCGDEFSLMDGTTALGDTSVSACTGVPHTPDPETAWVTPGFSKGSFSLGPGNHSVDITTTVNPFDGGTAYFRVTNNTAAPTPVPTLQFWGLSLLGLILGGAGAMRMRRRRV